MSKKNRKNKKNGGLPTAAAFQAPPKTFLCKKMLTTKK